MDGFADLFITLSLKDSKGNSKDRSFVLINQPCTEEKCPTS
jgi:hypothetical protein